MNPLPPLTLRQQRFVEELPTAKSQTEAAIKAGYSQSPTGSATVMASETLRKPNVIAAIEEQKRALRERVERAHALFAEHTQAISQAMVDRAEGSSRDSQRAGERILETVGVLQKEPLAIAVVDSSRELVAELRRHMTQAMDATVVTVEALPEPEAAERALAKVLGPGLVRVEDSSGVDP